MRGLQKAVIIGLALATGAVFAAGAPGDTACPKVRVGGYMSFGGLLGDLDVMNGALESRGYTGFKNYAYHLGAGMFRVRRNRLVTGLELKGLFWRPTSDDNSVSELYGASGLVNVGFNVLPEGRFLLYPYVGAGARRYALRLREKDVEFDTALARPTSDVFMWQRAGSLQAGLGFDFLLPSRRNPARARVIGLRAGYLFDVSRTRDWESADVDVRHGPGLSASGVYGQLVLGKSAKRPVWWCAHKSCPHMQGGGDK
jgi:hypothetical protein